MMNEAEVFQACQTLAKRVLSTHRELNQKYPQEDTRQLRMDILAEFFQSAYKNFCRAEGISSNG